MNALMRCSAVTALITAVLMSCNGNHRGDDAAPSLKDTTKSGMENMPGMEGMDMQDHKSSDHSDMLMLDAHQRLLAGIGVDTVRLTDFQKAITSLGVVATDESTLTVITSKVNGRIDHLYLRNPGEDVKMGQLLYDLYSETIYAEEQDLINLVSDNAANALIESARQKLRLHGLTGKQIADIEKSKRPNLTTTIFSPCSGYVGILPMREGQYVQPGDVLIGIASLDEVIVNAQVYPNEIASFLQAKSYQVNAESEGTTYEATKLNDIPALADNSKILNVRLRVKNTDHLLRPGMMTTVNAVSEVEKILTIPLASCLMENGMVFTWVLEKDGMFSRHMIRTGRTSNGRIEVLGGIQAGDCVVTSGIYLLNSEYILRKGANTMGDMKM